MSRLLSLSVFVAIAFLIVGSTHYYIWARLVRDVSLPSPWGGAATGLIIALGMSIPLALVVARLGQGPWVRLFLWGAFTWMGLFFLTLCLLAGTDVLRALGVVAVKLLPSAAPVDPERRLLIARLLGGSVMAAAALAGAAALRAAGGGPQVTRVTVSLRRLPKRLDGVTIAQISDLHVASLLGRDYVEQVVAQTNALSPGIIAITGDLVDGSVAQLRDAVAPLAGLRATHGVFFVTGNHQYYSGVDPWLDELRRLGIRVLRNERVSIGEGTDSFDLAGVDDWTAHGFGNGHGADLPTALRDRDPQRELVLLAHQPRAVFEAAEHGVGLMLSGHTHGGQIWPFGYIVKLVQPYLAGLAQHGQTQIYVNRGTGYWGPPMRLGSAPELTLLFLRSA